ncbi:MAG: hypothetical protein U9Q83_01260, partial [Bacteroidota bacterium]|nr:hypothetical protein [Bacteroidota bacterium]
MSKVITNTNDFIDTKRLVQSLTELDIEYVKKTPEISHITESMSTSLLEEIEITSDNPDKVIKFSLEKMISTVKVHEDNMDLFNVILKKYKENSKSGIIKLSDYKRNILPFINRTKKMGYKVKRVISSDKKVRFVMKKDVEE